MRTSLNRIEKIEHYISGNLSVSDKLLLEAQMNLDPELRRDVLVQKRVYRLTQIHFDMQLKKEFEDLHTAFRNDHQKRDINRKIDSCF